MSLREFIGWWLVGAMAVLGAATIHFQIWSGYQRAEWFWTAAFWRQPIQWWKQVSTGDFSVRRKP